MKRSCKTYVDGKEKEPVLLAKLRNPKACRYFDIFLILVLIWYVLAVPSERERREKEKEKIEQTQLELEDTENESFNNEKGTDIPTL
jgi:hypothetical protein